jgi:hypothetical protein
VADVPDGLADPHESETARVCRELHREEQPA